jgi:hypothetical protein
MTFKKKIYLLYLIKLVYSDAAEKNNDILTQKINYISLLETQKIDNHESEKKFILEDELNKLNNQELQEIYDLITKKSETPMSVETCIGTWDASLEIIQTILKSKALCRMEYIDQGGTTGYFGRGYKFSRKQHMETTAGAIFFNTIDRNGVLPNYIGKETERAQQIKTISAIIAIIAGLTHDVSHTAFSHLAELVKENHHGAHEISYQDKIHLESLRKSDIYDICKKFNIPIEWLDPDIHPILEAPSGKMSADRIYNINTALAYFIETKEGCKEIFNACVFNTEKKLWIFNSLVHAHRFANLPLEFITTIWNSHPNFVEYRIFAEVIKYAIKEKIISWEDFDSGTDFGIMEKLEQSKDHFIIYALNQLNEENFPNTYTIYNGKEPKQFENYDEHRVSKFRGIDPLILTPEMETQNIPEQLLSKADLNGYGWNLRYEEAKENCKNGFYIKYNTLLFPNAFFYVENNIKKSNEINNNLKENQPWILAGLEMVQTQIKLEEFIKKTLNNEKKKLLCQKKISPDIINNHAMQLEKEMLNKILEQLNPLINPPASLLTVEKINNLTKYIQEKSTDLNNRIPIKKDLNPELL